MTQDQATKIFEEMQRLGIDREEHCRKLATIYAQVVQRPFPAPHIITDMVSLAFPYMEQRHIYSTVQSMKNLIGEQEGTVIRSTNTNTVLHACN